MRFAYMDHPRDSRHPLQWKHDQIDSAARKLLPDTYYGRPLFDSFAARVSVQAMEEAAHVALFSDEAATCDDCMAARFGLRDGVIASPGKFEGEPLSTHHAYHVMLCGFHDATNGPYWRVGNVIVFEQDDGFLQSETFATEAEAIAHWEREIGGLYL